MHTIHLVKEFHHAFGHPVRITPGVPDDKHRLLRFRLIFEELMEFGRAIGLEGLCEPTDEEFAAEIKRTLAEFRLSPDAPVDLGGAADALADLDYVVQGSNLVFGFPAELLIADVHDANMSKLGPDGKPILDAAGKVVKGPNTRQPNTLAILSSFEYGGESFSDI